MAFVLKDVLRDPQKVAEHVNSQPRVHLAALAHDRARAVFGATFEPPTGFEDEGYPIEHARIGVPAGGIPHALPIGPKRIWKHRNGPMGDLCLWYPGDPRALRWEWTDGFGAFVAIVHRHLFFEEMWRRTGKWPVEDAPHGYGDHSIRTIKMQREAQLWNR